ncbi:MAG: PQQ-binding-like beta-propeller repeat protein [Pseudomonadota bacterium]
MHSKFSPNSHVAVLLAGLVTASAAMAESVTDKMLATPDPEDWLMFRANYQSWGHSALNAINSSNVDDLRLAWIWSMEPGTNQATPLVHDGVLYLPHPNDVITAHDARNGDLLWEYRRELPEPHLESGNRTRNIAIYGDTIYHASFDAHVIALNKDTGELLWETSVGDPTKITHSAGPIVAGGRVFSGRTCGFKDPGGCFIAAHDADTGEELWRRYVIPKPGEPGDETWGGLAWEKRKHASVWMVGSYDPSLELLYWGTSGPAPSPESLRGSGDGAMLYTNSTLALEPDTGEMAWYFQHLPRDNWDMDHTYERILVDAEVRPDDDAVWVKNPDLPRGTQKLLTGIPGKSGLVWTLNRETGEFYWAKETVEQNIIKSIDPATGEVAINEDVIPEEGPDGFRDVCPAVFGGKDWPAGAYNPEMKTLFMSSFNTCMKVAAGEQDPRYLLTIKGFPLPEGPEGFGRLEAIHTETGETLWKHQQPAPIYSVLSTGGGVIFAGDYGRRLKAFDAESGEVLWETILAAPVSGFPISYAVDGEQYIAVATGGGAGMTRALAMITGDAASNGRGSSLVVFKLGAKR